MVLGLSVRKLGYVLLHGVEVFPALSVPLNLSRHLQLLTAKVTFLQVHGRKRTVSVESAGFG